MTQWTVPGAPGPAAPDPDGPGHRSGGGAGVAADEARTLAEWEDVELQAYVEAARLLEVEAEDLQWTRTDPVELPGLRLAAELLRRRAATLAEALHGPGDAPAAPRGTHRPGGSDPRDGEFGNGRPGADGPALG